MMNNTLNNNKLLLEIKLAFAVASVALFYILKMHIEYRYGKYVPLLVYTYFSIIIFSHLIERKKPSSFKGLIYCAFISLPVFLFLCYGAAFTGSLEPLAVAAAKSSTREVGTAVGAVAGIFFHYLDRRRSVFTLEKFFSVVANCAVIGYFIASYLPKLT